MNYEREHVDLDQTKRHIVIEFEFGALAGAFGGAFEQVATGGNREALRHPRP